MLILVLMALFKGILTCPFVRLQADRAVLYTPIIGKLLSTVYTSRFASAFAVLYGSGIGILDAMHTVGRVMGNSYVENPAAAEAETEPHHHPGNPGQLLLLQHGGKLRKNRGKHKYGG